MKIDDLKNKWNEVPASSASYQRIDDEHILDIFVGRDNNSARELLVISDIEPALIRSSKCIDIVKGMRKDGAWATQIRLLKKEQEEVFTYLCWDLIEQSRQSKTKTSALEVVISRFLKWQKLMESGSNSLSEEVIKGLIGELIFAKKWLRKTYDWDTIMASWLGPEALDKDFVFEETWAEVKAVRSGKPFVTISSMEQLTSEKDGLLVVVTVDSTAPTDTTGFSVVGLINDIRQDLRIHPSAMFDFEKKLMEIGWSDKKEYENKCYAVRGIRIYDVTSEFPKLEQKNVPVEIIKARYDIALSGIARFERTEE